MDHQNADAISIIPAGEDHIFDVEEGVEDTDFACAIETLNTRVNITTSNGEEGIF